jgi:ribosomal protein S18 acetylase RimI-like enzyme
MDLTYFKRYRMEIHLAGRDLSPWPSPPEYRFLPWEPAMLDAFARAKYISFRNELDSQVFPCLAEFDGCRRLMAEIAQKPGFLPDATWLVAHLPSGWSPSSSERPEYCGTVQGIRDRFGLGAIQNLGVAPEHRQAGLGTHLLLLALAGFRRAGLGRAYLEVTAQNNAAIRLYRRVGFVPIRTVYKTVETKCST